MIILIASSPNFPPKDVILISVNFGVGNAPIRMTITSFFSSPSVVHLAGFGGAWGGFFYNIKQRSFQVDLIIEIIEFEFSSTNDSEAL